VLGGGEVMTMGLGNTGQRMREAWTPVSTPARSRTGDQIQASSSLENGSQREVKGP
jgi:hypothetical protein